MILFYLLLIVMPLVNHPLWSHFVGALTVTKYLGGLCLIYALLHLAVRGTGPVAFRTRLTAMFLLFYLLVLVSYFTKSLPGNWELSPFLSYTSFVLLFFITLAIVDSYSRLRWTLLVTIGSTALASLYVVREWQKYREFELGARPGWMVGDPNYFSASALLCLPLAYALMQRRGPRWEKAYLVGCMLVTLVAMSLAASRGGFLGMAVGFAFLAWYSGKRVRTFAIAGVLIALLSLAVPNSSFNRLLHPDVSDTEAADKRLVVWQAGLEMVRAHPLVGIGLGNFKALTPLYEPAHENVVDTLAHNTYLEVAAELGLPGLALFLAVLATSFRMLGRVRRHARGDGSALLRRAALGMQAGLLGCFVSIFFLSAETEKSLWLMIFLAPCLAALAAPAAEPAGEPAFSEDEGEEQEEEDEEEGGNEEGEEGDEEPVPIEASEEEAPLWG